MYGNLFDQKYEINFDYDIEKKYECIIENGNCLTLNGTSYKTSYNTKIGNRTLALDTKVFVFSREFPSKDESLEWKNKRFTGFKVTWKCIENCSEAILDYDKNFIKHGRSYRNKLFVILANLIHEGGSIESFWKTIKGIKYEWDQSVRAQTKSGEFYNDWTQNKPRKSIYETFLEYFCENLNITKELTKYSKYTDTVIDETLDVAAKMFLYIIAPTQNNWGDVYSLYSNWLLKLTPARIIGKV